MYLRTLINLSKLSPSVTVITASASSARTEAASASATHSSSPAAKRPLAMLCVVQQILHTGWPPSRCQTEPPRQQGTVLMKERQDGTDAV